MTIIPQETILPEYIEKLPAVLEPFAKFLGDNPWFVSENITFVDFPMYDLLDQLRYFFFVEALKSIFKFILKDHDS